MIRTSTDISQPTGKLWVVGIGPGDPHLLTPSARQALRTSHVVVGLHAYLEMIRPLLSDQQVIARPLTEEVERASEAVERAFGGQTVAIISSGDAGIYGMAGLVWELLAERKWSPKTGPEVEVVPGVSALNAAAALVGAPLMHDFAPIPGRT